MPLQRGQSVCRRAALGGERVSYRILQGDCREQMRTLDAGSVQCVVTSPPYWGLRSYGTPEQVWGGDAGCVHLWGLERKRGGAAHSCPNGSAVGPKHVSARESRQSDSLGCYCQSCGAWRGHLGLEPTPDLFVANLVAVFREVRRVLRDDGCVFLNIGDSYMGSGKARGGGMGPTSSKQLTNAGAYFENPVPITVPGFKPKDLCMIPARLALALQADGWWIRQDIIWAKGLSFCPSYSGSVMPESVTDRPTTSHEHVFLLTKNARYFYDAEAVREQGSIPAGTQGAKGSGEREGNRRGTKRPHVKSDGFADVRAEQGYWNYTGTRNLRSVWAIGPKAFIESHFATFPMKLVEPCIKAGTSEKGQCVACGAPWVRQTSNPSGGATGQSWHPHKDDATTGNNAPLGGNASRTYQHRKTTGWSPSCGCYNARYRVEFPRARCARHRHQQDAAGRWFRRVRKRPGLDHWPVEPQTVLDPFGGSGTTAIVALRLGRKAIIIELSPEYCEMAERSIGGPLFSGASA